MLHEITNHPCVSEQLRQVALDDSQMQVILAVGLLNGGDRLLNARQFTLHPSYCLGRDALDMRKRGLPTVLIAERDVAALIEVTKAEQGRRNTITHSQECAQ